MFGANNSLSINVFLSPSHLVFTILPQGQIFSKYGKDIFNTGNQKMALRTLQLSLKRRAGTSCHSTDH